MKAHLERLGYLAKGEVCGCDVVGVRPAEPGPGPDADSAPGPAAPPAVVVAELKQSFTLELVLQGVDRMAAADSVWLAVRASRRGRERDRRAQRLCRLLGFGLMAVDAAGGTVEVLAEPTPYRPRADGKRRARLLREHAGRRGDPVPGGGSRAPVMTAYRQRALRCAAALAGGDRTPRSLAALAPDAGRILLRDVYGWFERAGRGLYRLSPAGHDALARWPTEAEDTPTA